MSRGSIKPRLNADGVVTSYRVVYEIAPDPATGKRRQKTESAPNKKAAQKLLTQRLAELDGGTYAESSRETVEQFFTRWFALRCVRWRESTRRTYDVLLRLHVYPAFGSTRLQALRPEQVEALVASMAGRYAKSTVSNAIMLVRAGARDAMAWGLLVKDPTITARATGKPERAMRLWTTEEAGRFLRVCDGEYAALWRLLLDGGMRIGEALSLRWRCVDLVRAEVRIEVTLPSARPTEEGPPKTLAGRRTITLGQATVLALKQQRREQTARRLAHPVWHDEDRVFDRGDGALLTPTRVRDAFGRDCLQAGVPIINLHGLRHTSATTALAAGVSPVTLKERLGHETLAMTLGVYAHVLEEQRRGAADLLEAAYSAARDQSVINADDEQTNLA